MFEGVDVAPSIAVLEQEVVSGGQREQTEGLPELSPGQERAVAAMLVQSNTTNAAKAAQVGLRTLQGWLAEDANFNQHLRIARRELLSRTVAALQDRAPFLAHQLYEIVNDAKAPSTARLSAARALTHFAFKTAEEAQVDEARERIKQEKEIVRERNKFSNAWQVVPKPLKPLSGLQEKVLLALMEHPAISEAAKACGVGLRTVQQWMNQHDSFKLHYRNARRQAFDRTIKAAQDRMPIVIESVFSIVSNPDTPSTSKVVATRLLLELSRRGTALLDQAEQLEADQELLAGKERKRLVGALENQAFHAGSEARQAAREQACREEQAAHEAQQKAKRSG